MKKKRLLLFFVLCGAFAAFNVFSQNAIHYMNTREKSLIPASKVSSTTTAHAVAQVSDSTYDILYFCDHTCGTDHMLSGLDSLKTGWTFTVASDQNDFANLLNNNAYDLAILFVQNYPATQEYPDAVNALYHFVSEREGSGIFSTWSSQDEGYLNLFGAGLTGNKNMIQVTVKEPLSSWVTENPFTLTNFGWGIFSMGLTALNGSKVLGTFENGDAAIISSFNGRMMVYGFLNDVVSLPYIFTGGVKTARKDGNPADVVISCDFGEPATLVSYNDSAEVYQWRISRDGGTTYQDIADGELYSGSTNDTLNISVVSDSLLGHLYQCISYWGSNKSDTSRSAVVRYETIPPSWDLKDNYTLYSCNGVNAELDSLPLPYDNCGIDSIYQDSPYGASKADPSGVYPVDTTVVRYYVEDTHGNVLRDSFEVIVLTEKVLPEWRAWSASNHQITTYSSTTSNKQTFSELSEGALTGQPYYYDGHCCTGQNPPVDRITFIPEKSGSYTITTTAEFDSYTLLYTDPLDFTVSPTKTFVAGTCHYGTTPSQFSVNLNSGQPYYLFTSGVSASDSGNYSLAFSSPVRGGGDTLYYETCGTNATISFPAPEDNCSLDSVHFDSPYGTSTADASGTYPMGGTKVFYYLRDKVGNVVNDSLVVKVITDVTPATWLKDTVVAMCGDSADVTFPGPYDACGIDSIYNDSPYLTSTTDPSGRYPLGTTTIRYYVRDTHDNILVDSAQITLVHASPVWNISDTTLLACGSSATLILPEPSDLCGIDSIVHDSPYGVSKTDINGDYPIGNTTVHYSVYGAYGNVLTDSITITVVRDSIAPEIQCPGAFTEELAGGETTYSVNNNELDPEVTDECPVTLVNDFNSSETLAGVQLPVGSTTIVWTVTDAAGNSSRCSVTATITPPSAISSSEKVDEVKVYPNPSNGSFTVIVPAKAQLAVVDITGKQVFVKKLVSGNNYIDLTRQAKGIYQLRIVSGNSVYIKKAVVE